MFNILSTGQGKVRPSMFLKMGSYGNLSPYTQPILRISFRVTNKGFLLSGYFLRTPTERNDPFPESSIIYLSKSLVN